MIHIEKFRRVMEEVSAERGEFVFFGLFLREEAPGTWDLVISAPWLEAGKLKALEEFVEKVTAIVGKQELLSIITIQIWRRSLRLCKWIMVLLSYGTPISLG